MSDLMTRGVIMMPLELAMSSELSRMQFHSRAQDLLVERDTYRDLCFELLEELKTVNASAESDWGVDKEARALIAKAESILGENNGNAN